MNDSFRVSPVGDREIRMTRRFDATRPLVWKAMSEPAFLQRWLLGPPGWSMVACENDPRVGGAYKHVWQGPGAPELIMHGTYREVDAPARVVRNEIFISGGTTLGEHIATMVLSDDGLSTGMTITLLYESREARDGMIASGMEQGAGASYSRLDELLAEQGGQQEPS